MTSPEVNMTMLKINRAPPQEVTSYWRAGDKETNPWKGQSITFNSFDWYPLSMMNRDTKHGRSVF